MYCTHLTSCSVLTGDTYPVCGFKAEPKEMGGSPTDLMKTLQRTFRVIAWIHFLLYKILFSVFSLECCSCSTNWRNSEKTFDHAISHILWDHNHNWRSTKMMCLSTTWYKCKSSMTSAYLPAYHCCEKMLSPPDSPQMICVLNVLYMAVAS